MLDRLKMQTGSQSFSAQYQQMPVPSEGSLIKRAWLQTTDGPPEWTSQDRIIQSWDTASQAGDTNDYSACTTWVIRDREYYLLDAYRDRLEFPNLKRAVIAKYQEYQPESVLIEDASSGMHLVQELQDEETVYAIPIKVDRDKITRLEGASAMIECGRMILPSSAPWPGDYRDELLAFPHGRHDDQVDSRSQFLNWRGITTAHLGAGEGNNLDPLGLPPSSSACSRISGECVPEFGGRHRDLR